MRIQRRTDIAVAIVILGSIEQQVAAVCFAISTHASPL